MEEIQMYGELTPVEDYGEEVVMTGELTPVEEEAPRGVRNNNPGNLRHSDDKWYGKAEDQDDEEFITFDSPEAGIRAISKTLDTYEKEYGLVTVEDIINRWAPDEENDTTSYISHVSSELGVEKDDKLSKKHRLGLIKAIIKHENGEVPYDDKTIRKGIRMAGEDLDTYADMEDGWYKDKSTGDKFQVKGGRRL